MTAPEKTDRYYYKGSITRKSFDVSFEEKEGYKEVSARASGLNEMLKTEGFKEYLEKKGIAAKWGKGTKLMTVPFFERIYVPALKKEYQNFREITKD